MKVLNRLFTLFLLLTTSVLSAQDGAPMVPEDIKRPRRGENTIFAKDAVIGELSRGEAPVAAYNTARRALRALLSSDGKGAESISAAKRSQVRGKVSEIEAKVFRISDGREEPDGSVSFLFRYMGSGNKELCGEVYLTQKEDAWLADDILLVDRDTMASEHGPENANYLPYERFY